MELMEKGTITVAFMVYEDFELYSSGVYQHVKGD
jgi:Papain family cysteine protease